MLKHFNKNSDIFDSCYTIKETRTDALYEKLFGYCPTYATESRNYTKIKNVNQLIKEMHDNFSLVHLYTNENYGDIIIDRNKYDDFNRFALLDECDTTNNAVYIFSGDNIVIKLSISQDNTIGVSTGYENEKSYKKFRQIFNKYIQTGKEPEIGIFVNDNGNIWIKDLSIKMPVINIELNYGEQFVEINNSIIKKLDSKTSGLYIFYGPPGTGKTFFLKYLTSKVYRKFVFLPATLINSLVEPSLIGCLINNPNIILVVEDAEKAILSREFATGNESFVSTILNLSSGILGDILNISIILTFNTAKDKIDEALLRKGRLNMIHKFDKLTLDESKKLAKHLKKDYNITEPMILGDIYNFGEDNGNEKPKDENKIGF